MKKKSVSVALLLSVAVAVMAQEAPKKYDIKSGIVKIITTIMGRTVESTQYFDNFGAMEAVKAKTTVPGKGDIEVTTLSKEGKTFIVIPALKQVQEQPVQESINYLALTDDIIAKYNIKEVGTEIVCGKECTKYTSEISQLGQTVAVTVSVWKGFPIRSITSASGVEIIAEVAEFTEDAYILPQTFEIPEY